MDSKNKVLVGGGVLGLLVIVIIVGFYFKNSYSGKPPVETIITQVVSKNDPVDIVLDFYDPWLKAVKSTSTDPYVLGLATSSILSKELSTRLMSTQGRIETDVDPVLCQVTVPNGVNGRIVSQDANVARILITAKDKSLTAQSVFTLKHLNDGWFIDAIDCSAGEFAPVREFTFDKEGNLLKGAKKPLDSKYWYLVFEENNQLGHFAPLFLGADSTCIAMDKSETVCSETQFSDTKKVHVYGQMTELGVEVKKIEFLE